MTLAIEDSSPEQGDASIGTTSAGAARARLKLRLNLIPDCLFDDGGVLALIGHLLVPDSAEVYGV